ncbi:PRC-barrel domain-containing protein [Microvirga sp. HBU67558]|uniref:PRC-barrel domain-containing protein n=1 Tax=Microvirga TaxID=186650 RepID=UPI001B36F1D1|nr:MULTISPECIES: PRC-barrel domain-containing protein [unclassified Microvirga]MBQ0820859.1 PRC-barrel domain-containing protein [Microvirga sp. HBU67558]
MRTYYVFQSERTPDLRGFTESATGETLPAEHGPWALDRRIGPDDEWVLNVSRAVVAAGIIENGFYLWGPVERPTEWHPVIQSDRVEGTAVYGPDRTQIGTIKRLLIEKVSGRVLYVDVTFGGFLGIGVHHHTVPWDKLAYDRELEGYRTDVTEAQVQAAPAFYGDDRIWPDRKREQEMRDYWHDIPRGPI